MQIDQIELSFNASGLAVIQVALGVIMFGVALDLRVTDLRELIRAPFAPAVGLFCQFILLPAIACPIALSLAPSPSAALGMILVAACPGGNMSNLLTQLGGGRVAVSVGMTAVSTLAAVVATPLNFTFWGTRSDWTAALVRSVALDPIDMVWSVGVLLLVPVAIGMMLAHLRPGVAQWLSRPMKGLSAAFFGVVLVGAFFANVGVFVEAVGLVFFPVLVLNATALSLGYGLSALVGLPVPDRRAVAFEVGIQNSGLGLVLVFQFFDGLGGMAVVAAWWGIWHIVAGFGLAALFRAQGVKDRHSVDP